MTNQIKPCPPKEELRMLFDYYPDGSLHWKKNNKLACTATSRGRTVVTINNIQYLEARIIYTYFNGKIPLGALVIHVDGDEINNKINNLKLSTP